MSLKTEDLMATDQITVYKLEEGGEDNDQKKTNEFFSEEKYSLVHFNYYYHQLLVKNHPYQLNSLYLNSQSNYIPNGTSCLSNNNSLTGSVSPTGSINFQSPFCNNTQSILNQNKIQNDFFKQPNHQTNGSILMDNQLSTNSLNSTDNLSALKAQFNSSLVNSMFAQHCNLEQYRQAPDFNSVMSNLNAAVAAQNKMTSSPRHTPSSISNQAFMSPSTNTLPSPYSMYNLFFNGAMEKNKAFCDLLADSNNNSAIKTESLINRTSKDLSTSISNINKNSNSVNEFYETQFHNNHLSSSRIKLTGQKSANNDLSKENHFNFSNVNNSSISQNHKLPLETSNGYLNSTSMAPLVNDNTVISNPSSFLSSYYYGNAFNNLSSLNNKTIKKEPEKNQTFINNKLFCPSFPNSFNTNSLRLNSNMTNLSSSKNSTFSSNEFSSTCSPNSSSANSATSALCAFNLAESTAALYASPSINKNNCSINSSSINKSINSSIGEISNSLNPFSHLNNQFNQQFNNLNQKVEQSFDEQIKIENNLKDKKLSSNKVHKNSLNTINLNNSNSNSLSSSFNETCNSDQNISNSGSINTHVKKPLNAFMLFMKDNRRLVLEESTLKESAAINQKLGKMWHSLSSVEQDKYYEKAKKEKEIHHILYPNWTAKDNYAINIRKKKRKKEKSSQSRQFKEYTNSGGSLKKCRARYGLMQQESWCKPCKRKKKCTKFEDNLQNDEFNKG